MGKGNEVFMYCNYCGYIQNQIRLNVQMLMFIDYCGQKMFGIILYK